VRRARPASAGGKKHGLTRPGPRISNYAMRGPISWRRWAGVASRPVAAYHGGAGDGRSKAPARATRPSRCARVPDRAESRYPGDDWSKCPPLHGRRSAAWPNWSHAPPAASTGFVYRFTGNPTDAEDVPLTAGLFPEGLLEPVQLRFGSRQPAGVVTTLTRNLRWQLPAHPQPAPQPLT